MTLEMLVALAGGPTQSLAAFSFSKYLLNGARSSTQSTEGKKKKKGVNLCFPQTLCLCPHNSERPRQDQRFLLLAFSMPFPPQTVSGTGRTRLCSRGSQLNHSGNVKPSHLGVGIGVQHHPGPGGVHPPRNRGVASDTPSPSQRRSASEIRFFIGGSSGVRKIKRK